MNCPNCKKEVGDKSKYCEHCGKQVRKDYSKIVDDILSGKNKTQEKKKIRLKKLKNFVLVLSVLIISTAIISLHYELAGESLGISIPLTILVVFVYKKLAKKFDL